MIWREPFALYAMVLSPDIVSITNLDGNAPY